MMLLHSPAVVGILVLLMLYTPASHAQCQVRNEGGDVRDLEPFSIMTVVHGEGMIGGSNASYMISFSLCAPMPLVAWGFSDSRSANIVVQSSDHANPDMGIFVAPVNPPRFYTNTSAPRLAGNTILPSKATFFGYQTHPGMVPGSSWVGSAEVTVCSAEPGNRFWVEEILPQNPVSQPVTRKWHFNFNDPVFCTSTFSGSN